MINPTVSIRPPRDLRDAVEAWAALNGMKVHRAYLELIWLGLRGRPNQVTLPEPEPRPAPERDFAHPSPVRRSVVSTVPRGAESVSVGLPASAPGSRLKGAQGKTRVVIR